jgi:hypothetical protein
LPERKRLKAPAALDNRQEPALASKQPLVSKNFRVPPIIHHWLWHEDGFAPSPRLAAIKPQRLLSF